MVRNNHNTIFLRPLRKRSFSTTTTQNLLPRTHDTTTGTNYHTVSQERPEILPQTSTASQLLINMRLQLSLATQDLPKTLLGGAPNPFAVVIDASSHSGGGQQQQEQEQQQQQLLGQTEVLKKTCDADWTKLFYIENWDFGKPRQLVVTIYNGKQAMSTVLFEVGDILGAPGSRLAKQLEKDGKGIIVAHVEEATSAGILKFQLRGWNLVNVERGLGLLNKSDPFFELQRWHASARAWDVVFRSAVVNNDLEPLWNESYVEVHALCGGRQTKQKFRLAMYDDNGNGKRKEMGHVLLSVHDMVSAVNPSALSSSDCVNEEPGFTLTLGNREMGKVLVAVAEVTGAVTDDTHVSPPVEPVEEVEDIVGASSTSRGISVDNEEEEIVVGKPNFVAYVSGGCELRVVVAIDATASNGNPREKSSLHYFRDNGRNTYEEVLFSLCSTLSKYDSDQKYPVFGFGAKQGSGVSHCFPMGSIKEVEGVDGILDAYRTAFRSGIVMSSPRIFSEVIRRATQDAREHMVRCVTRGLSVRKNAPRNQSNPFASEKGTELLCSSHLYQRRACGYRGYFECAKGILRCALVYRGCRGRRGKLCGFAANSEQTQGKCQA